MVPTEMLRTNGRASTQPPSTEPEPADDLRTFAREHLRRVRRVKMHVAAYVLGIVVLTPLWALVEWQDNGAFERWSNDGNPGDWEPWILYVVLGWGLFVAIAALKAYFDRPTTEDEVDREVARLTARR